MNHRQKQQLVSYRPTFEALEARLVMDGGGPRSLAPLVPFGSNTAFDQHFINQALTRYASLLGQEFGPVIYQEASASSTSIRFPGYPGLRGPQTSPSTNLQSLGVLEGDAVQSDADHLYVLSGNQLVIIDKQPDGGIVIDSRTAVPANPLALFLDGTRLTVVSQVLNDIYYWFANTSDGNGTGAAPTSLSIFPNPDPRLQVAVYDVSNAGAPQKVQDVVFEGAFVAARAVGHQLNLVVQDRWSGLPAPQPQLADDGTWVYETESAYLARIHGHVAELVLPHYYDTVTSAPLATIVEPTEVYQGRLPSDHLLTTIFTFDMQATGAGVVDTHTLLTDYVEGVYATTEHLYLATAAGDQSGMLGTTLQQFDLVAGGLAVGPAAFLPIVVRGQFGIDESAGYLRVVGPKPYAPYQPPGETGALYVLRQIGAEFEFTGSLEGINFGNRLTATRFAGGTLFFVRQEFGTYYNSTLLAVDLTDRAHPELAGQTSVQGISSYLQVFDDQHLLVFGANETDNLLMALFDVSLPGAPELVNQVTVPGRNTVASQYLEPGAQGLAFLQSAGWFAVPTGTASDVNYDSMSQDYLYRLDVETGFQLIGFVGHDSQVQRSILEGNRFYSIADDSVRSQQILAKVPLGPGDTTYSIGPSSELRLTDNPRSVVLPPLSVGADRTVSGPLVVFKVTNPTGLTATIDWGDGTQTPATILPSDNGVFAATGHHTYVADGLYTVTTTFVRDGQIVRSDFRQLAVNPIDPHVESYLQRLYQNLLGRAIDSAGLRSWAGSLKTGASRAMIAQLILDSVEYQTRQIQTMYHEWLGRAVENEGLSSWLQFLGTGRSLDDVRTGILSSQEYSGHAATEADFVARLYQILLGRQADSAGLAAWTNALSSGLSRAQVVQLLQQSQEAAIRQITLNYENILGRSGEEQGIRFFAGALQAGVPSTAALAIFLGSSEYYAAS